MKPYQSLCQDRCGLLFSDDFLSTYDILRIKYDAVVLPATETKPLLLLALYLCLCYVPLTCVRIPFSGGACVVRASISPSGMKRLLPVTGEPVTLLLPVVYLLYWYVIGLYTVNLHAAIHSTFFGVSVF